MCVHLPCASLCLYIVATRTVATATRIDAPFSHVPTCAGATALPQTPANWLSYRLRWAPCGRHAVLYVLSSMRYLHNHKPHIQGRVTQLGNTYGPHAASLLPPDQASMHPPHQHNGAPVKTLFAWQRAVSPHLAVEQEGRCGCGIGRVCVCVYVIQHQVYAHTPYALCTL